MEYEAYEPDPNDEYYDQMCEVAYANMFNLFSLKEEDE
jgi:hypothetical protein